MRSRARREIFSARFHSTAFVEEGVKVLMMSGFSDDSIPFHGGRNRGFSLLPFFICAGRILAGGTPSTSIAHKSCVLDWNLLQ